MATYNFSGRGTNVAGGNQTVVQYFETEDDVTLAQSVENHANGSQTVTQVFGSKKK
ncbi:hypothetical protein [Nonomuraea sp. NPDC046570]|uniref:hypothetical protein n=1 Tax=Nonomuraea sp. NPDC046570 TaxID=3155255 RepID=UPI0033F2C17A